MFYNMRMTVEEIKSILDKRGISQKELAEQLHIHPMSLSRILRGAAPLSEQLAAHIEYILGAREAVLVYRVDVPTHKVEELTAGRGCVTEADHREALQAIIQHNMLELAKLGAELDWSPEQREALGIAKPLPGGGYEVREPFA